MSRSQPLCDLFVILMYFYIRTNTSHIFRDVNTPVGLENGPVAFFFLSHIQINIGSLFSFLFGDLSCLCMKENPMTIINEK